MAERLIKEVSAVVSGTSVTIGAAAQMGIGSAGSVSVPIRRFGATYLRPVWREICKLLNDPRTLQQEDQQAAEAAKQSPETERHRAQLLKLQHGLGRLIDSYAEGMIEKDQFTSRMKQTKARIAEIEGKLSAASDHTNRQQQLQLLSGRLAELSAHLGPHIENAEWSSRREVIRAVVQRIEVNPTGVTIVPRFSVATPISIGRTALSARLPQA